MKPKNGKGLSVLVLVEFTVTLMHCRLSGLGEKLF